MPLKNKKKKHKKNAFKGYNFGLLNRGSYKLEIDLPYYLICGVLPSQLEKWKGN